MNSAVIGVGSNINAAQNISRAKEALSHGHRLDKESAFVKTSPIGFSDQPDFLNGAFLVSTELSIDGFKDYLHGLEDRLGRHRRVGRIDVARRSVGVEREHRHRRVLGAIGLLAPEVVLERVARAAQQAQPVPSACARVGAQRPEISCRHHDQIGVLRDVMRDAVESVDPLRAHRARRGLRLAVHQLVHDERTAGPGEELAEPDLVRLVPCVEIARAFYPEIENPVDLAPAIKRAIERVKKGEPVLLDGENATDETALLHLGEGKWLRRLLAADRLYRLRFEPWYVVITVVVLATCLWIIVSGVAHFDSAIAFSRIIKEQRQKSRADGTDEPVFCLLFGEKHLETDWVRLPKK